jgi:galactokinase/mevalonate kinase-like predicted kinase
MDFPEGARVVNISVNLKVHGSAGPVTPPCECYCRYIKEPVIYLRSVDLQASKKITTVQELYNFGNDHLSLLKAGVVASGIVPPCFERMGVPLQDILEKLLDKPGGLEVVSRVNTIPKGSRLAVSTTLLATIITRLMRFSGQITGQTGPLLDAERRIIASRAILGEWLGGSGGGWQDSGGLWPGIKIITGKRAKSGDPEYAVSRGCLLPEHAILSESDISQEIESKITNSMVLVHGGISQDVGPILEMVTEKYLLRYDEEWTARLKGIELFDNILHALKTGDMKSLGALTTEDWEESIQRVIPWVNNAFTEDLIHCVKKTFLEDFWGFLMLGGMSGGGMAFIVNPEINTEFKEKVADIMQELKHKYAHSFPFIVDPVVYDFELNHEGIVSHLLTGDKARIPGIQPLSPANNDVHTRSENDDEYAFRQKYGFDADSHDHMKAQLKNGSIGLQKNRLPQTVTIENVSDDEVLHFDSKQRDKDLYRSGMDALTRQEVAVVTFAGGLGSRWSGGASVVKPINPFIKLEGKYRTFLEIHLAKSRRTEITSGHRIPHVFTTSYLTHNAVMRYLKLFHNFDYQGNIYLSPGKSIGHRVYPMERDLRFYWEEQLRQKQDEHVQNVRDDAHRAFIEWTRNRGESEDYAENRPIMRFNPPGHWYEIPNLIKNGVLARMLTDNPRIQYLFCHNIDTLGASLDPSLIGIHINNGSCITFEVIPKRIDDKGGGLAKIDGAIRLIEGLSLPGEEDEYKLTYYNSLSNWITIDSMLDYFGLDRTLVMEAENDPTLKEKISDAIRIVEKKIPTYVTIKNVKYLWGSGQEDIHPVAQFEKLWGDMTILRDLPVGYVLVPRQRGQQLKEPSQLYSWMLDGSFEYIKRITVF